MALSAKKQHVLASDPRYRSSEQQTVPRRPISAERMAAARASIKAGISPLEICRQNGISLASYYRFKTAMVREDATKNHQRGSAPRLTASQIDRLCRFFPALAVYQKTRVAEDVRQAVQATLYSSARPRPSSIVIELEKAVAKARARPSKSIVLSRRAWVFADGDAEAEERVLPRRKRHLGVLLAALERAWADVEETDDNRGGRRIDPRLGSFISNLGAIYESAANKALTYKIDPASGELNSPFGLFVLEALRVFYPEKEILIGTVRTLVQHLAQFKPDAAKRGPRKRAPESHEGDLRVPALSKGSRPS